MIFPTVQLLTIYCLVAIVINKFVNKKFGATYIKITLRTKIVIAIPNRYLGLLQIGLMQKKSRSLNQLKIRELELKI